MAASVLAQVSLPANTNTTVYTTSFTAFLTIRMVNRTNSQVRVHLALADASTPTDDEYIEYNTAIEPFSVLSIDSLPVGTAHNLIAKASVAGVTIFVSGVPA